MTKSFPSLAAANPPAGTAAAPVGGGGNGTGGGDGLGWLRNLIRSIFPF